MKNYASKEDIFKSHKIAKKFYEGRVRFYKILVIIFPMALFLLISLLDYYLQLEVDKKLLKEELYPYYLKVFFVTEFCFFLFFLAHRSYHMKNDRAVLENCDYFFWSSGGFPFAINKESHFYPRRILGACTMRNTTITDLKLDREDKTVSIYTETSGGGRLTETQVAVVLFSEDMSDSDIENFYQYLINVRK